MSGSSYHWGTPPTKGSIPQADAAALTRPKTSFTDGRSARSALQHSSNSFQTSSERPRFSAFAGLEGLPPSRTLKTTSDPESLPNGSVPMSTYTRRIDICVCWTSCGMYLVYHHRHRIYISFFRRHTPVQSELGRNKKLRCHKRSGPPAHLGLRRIHPQAWVMYDGHEPEVREACCDGVDICDQNVGLNNMSGIRRIFTGRLTPFKSPCTILAL